MSNETNEPRRRRRQITVPERPLAKRPAAQIALEAPALPANDVSDAAVNETTVMAEPAPAQSPTPKS